MAFCSWARQEIYRDNFSSGMYVCSQCEYPLFSSTEKYKHHTPWPAFKNPVHPDSLSKKIEDEAQDSSDAFAYKISCGKCGNPLGHEFLKDGPDGPRSEVRSWAREQVRAREETAEYLVMMSGPQSY